MAKDPKEIEKKLRELWKRMRFLQIYLRTKEQLRKVSTRPDVLEMLKTGNYELHTVSCKVCGYRYKAPPWIKDKSDICGYCCAGVPSPASQASPSYIV
jgi:uncharacterized protein CbrC (UPF0167 family)